MKHSIKNIKELSPIALLSVLLFVSCTQLPVIQDDAPTGTVGAGQSASTESTPDLQQENIQTEAKETVLTDPAAQESPDREDTLALDDGDIEGDMPGLSEPAIENAPDSDDLLAEAEIPAGPTSEELAIYTEELLEHQQNVETLCEEIGDKLGSVSAQDCLEQELQYAGAYSVNARPLAMKDFTSRNGGQDRLRVLIMGGIHGDEYSSISIMFKWMSLLQESGGNSFNWRFLPSVNPDGLLDGQAVRQNASGVDLNRNFPSQDWDAMALEYWRNNTGANPRRYPGEAAASEPEVRWIIGQIEKFHPHVIVSVHAPYHLLDFDGPAQAPEKIGDLYLHQLGVYPGSLGNYAGLDLGIPVVTLELPSAGIMPSNEQIENMWIDMLTWLNSHLQYEQSASL